MNEWMNEISHLSFLKFLIVVQVQLSPFSPHHGPPRHPSLPPTLKPNPFGFVHVSFIHVPWWTFPYYPSPPPVTISLYGEPFWVWEMWPRPHSEKRVGSEVGGQDPHPQTGSPVGNQACVVLRLLWDLLLLKLPHPELRQQMFTEYL